MNTSTVTPHRPHRLKPSTAFQRCIQSHTNPRIQLRNNLKHTTKQALWRKFLLSPRQMSEQHTEVKQRKKKKKLQEGHTLILRWCPTKQILSSPSVFWLHAPGNQVRGTSLSSASNRSIIYGVPHLISSCRSLARNERDDFRHRLCNLSPPSALTSHLALSLATMWQLTCPKWNGRACPNRKALESSSALPALFWQEI